VHIKASSRVAEWEMGNAIPAIGQIDGSIDRRVVGRDLSTAVPFKRAACPLARL